MGRGERERGADIGDRVGPWEVLGRSMAGNGGGNEGKEMMIAQAVKS